MNLTVLTFIRYVEQIENKGSSCDWSESDSWHKLNLKILQKFTKCFIIDFPGCLFA